DSADYLGHLGLGERRTDAATDAATKGKPSVGLRLAVDEPLWTELVGLGVEILAQMNDGNRRVDTNTRREVPSADRTGLGERASAGVDHRPQPQRLCHDGIEVCVIVGDHLVPQAT